MSFLLDVNALIAGVYEDHEHHAVMRAWMMDNKGQSFHVATLVMTGCLRVLMTVSGEKKITRLTAAIRAFKDFYEERTVEDDIELDETRGLGCRA